MLKAPPDTLRDLPSDLLRRAARCRDVLRKLRRSVRVAAFGGPSELPLCRAALLARGQSFENDRMGCGKAEVHSRNATASQVGEKAFEVREVGEGHRHDDRRAEPVCHANGASADQSPRGEILKIVRSAMAGPQRRKA